MLSFILWRVFGFMYFFSQNYVFFFSLPVIVFTGVLRFITGFGRSNSMSKSFFNRGQDPAWTGGEWL